MLNYGKYVVKLHTFTETSRTRSQALIVLLIPWVTPVPRGREVNDKLSHLKNCENYKGEGLLFITSSNTIMAQHIIIIVILKKKLGTFSSPSTKFINDWLLCPTGLVSTSLVSLFWFLTVNRLAQFLVTAPSPLAPRSHTW